MNPTSAVPSRTFRIVAILVFLPAFSVWTWKLLSPNPVPEPLMKGLRSLADILPFLAAKTLHAGGYAFLTSLLWISAPPRLRWFGVAFMVFHGIGSEIGQSFVPNRTGKVTDVLIDTMGITLGVVLCRATLRRVLKPRSEPAEPLQSDVQP